MVRLLLVLFSVAWLGACNLQPLERPTVEVRGVAVGALSWSGLEGQISLEVFNPNAFGLPLTRVEWALSIGAARALTGQVELSQTLPAKGAAPVIAELQIGASDVLDVAAELARGTRAYRLTGRLHFRTQVAAISVDIAHDGQLGDLRGGW